MGRALPDHGPLTHALFSHYSGLPPAQLMGSPAPAIQHPKAYDERNVSFNFSYSKIHTT